MIPAQAGRAYFAITWECWRQNHRRVIVIVIIMSIIMVVIITIIVIIIAVIAIIIDTHFGTPLTRFVAP